MAQSPAVSVIIPAWNEEPSIAGCLEAVAAQTWDTADLEVVVVDGASTDGTVEAATNAALRLGLSCRIESNPERRTSTSLNVGLQCVRGRYVVRLDARSRVQPDYIEKCITLLDQDARIGVVGGAQVAHAGPDTLEARGIARSLRNRWFTGLSRYRRSTTSGRSDTVWMGAFRTSELAALGGWDRSVALNEDYELNRRFRDSGSIVWFEASLRSSYIPRSTFSALWIQHFRFGRVKGTWWARDQRPNARQVGLLTAPLLSIGAVALISRRIGWFRTATAAVVVALALDDLGSDEPPASSSERPVAVAAAVTSACGWLVGVMVGAIGERLGVEHPHG